MTLPSGYINGDFTVVRTQQGFDIKDSAGNKFARVIGKKPNTANLFSLSPKVVEYAKQLEADKAALESEVKSLRKQLIDNVSANRLERCVIAALPIAERINSLLYPGLTDDQVIAVHISTIAADIAKRMAERLAE